MYLTCLCSGSKGNCYLLQSGKETLVIEAGISFAKVKQALNFSLQGVVGCLITHRHKDHSKSIKDFMSAGIKVLALEDVFHSQNIDPSSYYAKILNPMKGYRLGGFKIFTLAAYHDAPCLAYLIEHQDLGKLLFATDTMMLEYKISGLQHIMIEANYADEVLGESIERGYTAAAMKSRLMTTHMELGTIKGFIKDNDLSSVSEIILLHLSSTNSDPEEFRKAISRSSGKPVYVAQAGLKIELKSTPY